MDTFGEALGNAGPSEVDARIGVLSGQSSTHLVSFLVEMERTPPVVLFSKTMGENKGGAVSNGVKLKTNAREHKGV